MTPPSTKNDSKGNASTEPFAFREKRRDLELRARFSRTFALRSAWAVLAPSGLWADGKHITETGRKLNEQIRSLGRQGIRGRGEGALRRIDGLLDAFECQMLDIASELSVAELRSTLLGQTPFDRPGVLDLLDLMLGSEAGGLDRAAARLPSIDCLITFLCAGASGDSAAAALQDPVTLTPRLHELCQKADTIAAPEVAKLEAEFLAAAQVDDPDSAEDEEGTPLKKWKIDLGASYFTPRLLRAIVTYNTAVFRRIHQDLSRSQDWGSIPETFSEAGAHASVFATTVLPKLGEALQRRVSGGVPSSTAIDRIAWSLDLAYPDESERSALLSSPVGHADNVNGTVIMVGLLCRAAVALEAELLSLGISQERLASEWVGELDDELRGQISDSLLNHAHPQASLLSVLKSKFLYKPLGLVNLQESRRGGAAAEASSGRVGKRPGELVKEALEAIKRAPRSRIWSSGLAGRLAALGAVAVAVVLLVEAVFPRADLSYFSRTELEGVSSLLDSGGRTGDGRAFVGTIEDDFSRLTANQRKAVATQLVERLRAQGIREIMIYDNEKRLRIQALGQQSARVVAIGSPSS